MRVDRLVVAASKCRQGPARSRPSSGRTVRFVVACTEHARAKRRSAGRRVGQHQHQVLRASPRRCAGRTPGSGTATSGARRRWRGSSGRRMRQSRVADVATDAALERARRPRVPCAARRGSSCASVAPGARGTRRSPRSLVAPVELHAVTNDHSGGRADRRYLPAGPAARAKTTGRCRVHAAAAPWPLRARMRIARQQPRAGHRRERHRDQPLRVVRQLVTVIGLGPGPVEHVLAVGMIFRVQRRGSRRARCRA